jgi:hypothetical protein
MQKYNLILSIILLLTANLCLAGPDVDSLALDKNKKALLKKAVKLLDEEPTSEDIQWLNEQLIPGNEPINILAAAILYKSDSIFYENVLDDYFTVNDYSERAGGKQNIISQDNFVTTIGKIERQVDKEFAKRDLTFLFGYWYFRDRNEWVPLMTDQPVSVARFFRTAFLSAVLDLEQGHILKLATRLDRDATGSTEQSR